MKDERQELPWFALSWGLRRWPGRERATLLEAARASQAEISHRQEIAKMSETIDQTWDREMLARGEARGEMAMRREDLRMLLEEPFSLVRDAP